MNTSKYRPIQTHRDKVLRDYGSISNLSKSLQVPRVSLINMMAKPVITCFKSDKNRLAFNFLLENGYITYADEIESKDVESKELAATNPNKPKTQGK
ncbi:hypothetical protein [Helicobacter sp. 11S02629-2]|uniref:hypothetical protein n=1 Tax=Helicobacter sp. 11S02629-2 TaxID=1476195 RepID=UPI000BA53A59|nr:hypothetical protein [Helicobacter sp. 11S02629-2]PAF44154.1 hypothetical protein BKH40_06040 [Helicobacter sp. 11S02629-2]